MKESQRLFVLILAGLFFYGCGSSGMRIVTYSQDRPRVDQEIAGIDNEGYVGGSMKSSNIASRKKTRKIYVMEISKESTDIGPVEDSAQPQSISSEMPAESTSPAIDSQEAVVAISPQAGRFVQYTVEKDDTLQKIAKKFYGSYTQWTRIYEANKTIIKNPDRVKPGTILEIPMD